MKRDGNSGAAASGGIGWRRYGIPAALLLVGGLAACSPTAYLEPAPTAATLPKRSDADVATVAGVRVVAIGDAWSGVPPSLSGVITPVKVDIRNDSDHPVDIRYEDFKLTAAGFTSVALPPYKITGRVGGPRFEGVPVVPEFAFDRFFIAPAYAPFYDWDFDQWNGPFAFDLGYYSSYYPLWQQPMPTRYMRAQAIPEGVLNPGGRLSGFLYFQKVNKKAGAVTLSFNLVNADNGSALGKADLPFVAK